MGEPLVLWEKVPSRWPRLVVPGNPLTFVVDSGTGQLLHFIAGVSGPYRTIDLDGDGIPELVGYQLGHPEDGGQKFVPPRLHLFRGTDRKAAARRPRGSRTVVVRGRSLPLVDGPALDGTPVTVLKMQAGMVAVANEAAAVTDPQESLRRPIQPQEEAVEWVPPPWATAMAPEPEEEYGWFGSGGLPGHALIGEAVRRMFVWRRNLLVPALLFLGFVGVRLVRKGWSGLWLPAGA
jgi:hypothetical protein